MKRIMVMGISVGVGKFIFAREVGACLNIGVYHLGQLFWKSNWTESSLAYF